MKKINLILTTALFATLVSCVNGDDYGTPDLSSDCTTEAPTKDVADIKALATTNNPTVYGTDDVIEAYVTSSDEGGNFYKTISLVSTNDLDNDPNSVGFSIPINAYNIYTKFEPGRKVYIHLKDLYYSYATLTNSLEIGELYIDDTYGPEIGRISAVKYENVVLRGCDKVNEDDLVKHITIADINDSYLHKLIEFDNVQFTDASLDHTYHDESLSYAGASATNHNIVDTNGSSIIVRCSAYASFATEQIPSGNGKIRGVLTKYNGTYQFMIRTLNDVKLTDPRIVPLFEEPFDTNFPNWVVKNVAGTQQWAVQANYGNPTYNAYINGYGNNNEDWLISPSLDLGSVTSATLTFESNTRYSGAPIQIFVSTNYDGSSAPSTATWTQLTGAYLPTWVSGSYTGWYSSGGLDISAYTGNSNVRIAFKYTSTTSSASAWEIDNVKIVGQ